MTASRSKISHTLHQEVYNTLRAALQIQDVLTGDPKSGASYFNGAGKATYRSATGDPLHIGARLDPAIQRFLFPGGRRGRRGAAGAPVTVTVTPARARPSPALCCT